LLIVSRSFMNIVNSVLWRMAISLNANKVNLFVSSFFFLFSGTMHQTFKHTRYSKFPNTICVRIPPYAVFHR
jgi:hypothetical protein